MCNANIKRNGEVVLERDVAGRQGIIIGSAGEIPKSIFMGLENLRINKFTYREMQEAAILESCHVMRKVLNA